MSNERLSDALATALEMAINSMDAAAGFLAGEMPEVIEQLLMWKLAKSAFLLAFCAGLAFIIYREGMRLFRHRKAWVRPKYLSEYRDHDDEYGFWYVAYFVGTIPGTIFILIAGATSTLTALQILIAPKVYLIEYAAQLAR